MSNIRLEIEEPYNGQFVTFTAPCNCDAITDGLVINDNVYTVIDAVGNCVTDVGGAWVAGAKVSVVLDVNNRKAYVQTTILPKVTSDVPLRFSINSSGGLTITY